MFLPLTKTRNLLVAGTLAIGLVNHGYSAEPICEKAPHQHTHSDQHLTPPLLRGIELSNAQKAQLKTILDAATPSEPDAPPAPSSAVQQLITAKSFDRSRAAAIIQTQQSAMAEHQLQRWALEQQIYQLLTAEQQLIAQQNLARPHPPAPH